MKRVLILGVNGFIGHHLSKRILAHTDWDIYGMDMQTDRISDLLPARRFHFFEGDITINREWIEYHVKKCDAVLPLVAIATPATYVRDPLRVFELDFEANLPIVRACVRYRKRIIFPSTSEVYGMCRDAEFDPDNSELVLGPIGKPRWIYACAKQLMDRVIHAYGMQVGLDYTLFRPFNWIGSGLDSINTAKEGSSRVITQFLGHIVRGEPIKLVDGGTQKRAFTYIDDGIDALIKIIANADGIATGKIYNIGNPANNVSVRELATMMLQLALTFDEYRESAKLVDIVETTSADYYGPGYQDVQNRVPKIDNTCADLDWRPSVSMGDALRRIFEAYRGQVAEARLLVDSRPDSGSFFEGSPQMLLALKVDVDTFRGTREGAPALAKLLRKHAAPATFLWSLGRDHTGRAIRRVLRPGFMRKVQRTSVVKHYGLRTLLYGTLLPGPDIGRRGRNVMRAVRDEGFEVGIHTWDHIRWQDGVVKANAAWTQAEMLRACDRFTDVFKADPKTHGAAGWQMNVHALRLTQRLGFDYASDSRGAHPFLPVWNGELIRCPQFPTTLPTLDELIGRDGVTETNVAERLLARTKEPNAGGHVFTLHAELEGMDLLPVFEQLLSGWKAQGWQLVAMRELYESVQAMALPRCEVALGEIPGRSGTLLKQGVEFLADNQGAATTYAPIDAAA